MTVPVLVVLLGLVCEITLTPFLYCPITGREKEKRRRAKTELESSFVFIAPVEKARVLNRDRNPFYSGLIFSKKVFVV